MVAILARRGDACVVTVDVGGTNFDIKVFRNEHDIESLGGFKGLMNKNFDDPYLAYEQDLAMIIRAIHRLEKQYGRVREIALAVAGRVDEGRTSLVMAGNLTHWVGRSIKQSLIDEFGCRVVLGNDAEAAAFADAVYGLGVRDLELRGVPFLGLGWGSGVGGACVRYVSGRPIVIPSEPGHVLVGPDNGVSCGCPISGRCLESYCGGDNLPFRFEGKRGKELPREVYREEILPWLALGLQSYLCAQPVPMIIYHGSVACGQDWLVPELEDALKQYGFDVRIYQSWFGLGAGAVGALSLLSLPE